MSENNTAEINATDDELKIWAIADELVAEGEKPTLVAIRKRRGGGSYTTISEAIKKYKENNAIKNTPRTKELPDPLKEKAERFLGDIYDVAQTLADERLQGEREALGRAREEIELSQAEAAEMADQMELEIITLRKELENALKQVEAKICLIEEKDKQNHSLKEEIAALKSHSNGLQESVKLERVERNKAVEKATELSGFIEAKTAEYEIINSQLEETSKKLIARTSELSNVEAELKTSLHECSTLKEERAKLDEHLLKSNEERHDMDKDIAVKSAELLSLNNTIKGLESKIDVVINEKEELKSLNVRLSTKLEISVNQVKELKSTIENMRD